MQGYDPSRSQVKNDALARFIQAPLTGDLSEIPGIGPIAKERLAEQDITTSFALIGKFLSLKGEGVSTREHCDKFFIWLRDTGISSHRNGIVRCIAEKVDTMFPGIYNPADFHDSNYTETSIPIKNEMSSDLYQVTGMTIYNKNILNQHNINTVFELTAKFLILENENSFSNWLTEIGITSNNDQITSYIMEKSKVSAPNYYKSKENNMCYIS